MIDRGELTLYWLEHYVDKTRQLCSLCGNTGLVDTRHTAISEAGVSAGRINFCICPNGQQLLDRALTEKGLCA
jgi:hypothetical protein